MSDFDSKTIQTLQKLCRIALSREEEKELEKKLDAIVDHISQLETIPTEDIPPCIRVQQFKGKATLRDDIIQDLLSKDLFLENAPQSFGGMVQVPPVLDKEH
jgi:aspartyl/glutamyl-tRNA(Asn/Gln) amidotransferase C subunit